jgi:large subunit ribosomal protein L30
MSDKASKTIWIKWVRSGIGFSHRQKGFVRSLGLHRLNEVVERPDTPQIRGLVAKVPHLVSIVAQAPSPAGASLPEYTLRPPEVLALAKTAEGSSGEGAESVSEAVSALPTGPEDAAPEIEGEKGSERPDKEPNE